MSKLATLPSKRRRLIAVLAALLVAGLGAACVEAWPALDANASGSRLERMHRSPQWYVDRFRNPQPLWANSGDALAKLFRDTPDSIPKTQIEAFKGGSQLATPAVSGLRATWFGHSSALLEIDRVSLLIDPMWSTRPSPLSMIGPKRWYDAPISLAHLPRVDAVLISHDHYDHLDRRSIEVLGDTTARFIVPLGVGAILERWGIEPSRIAELDWWESTQIGDVQIVSTPARHASGRLNPQGNATLWSGYALLGPQHRAWYSGDTGYHDDLSEIGRRYGPFDITLIEAGQYDADWPDWHLGPEQAVDAHRAVGGKVMLPVHWGLLKLAHHTWTEPVERVLAAAHCRGVTVATPRPGEPVEPAALSAQTPWWPTTPWQTASEQPIVSTLAGEPAKRRSPARCTDPTA
ncbi:MBL fold metallo-hydrolase [Stenotrophomonas maltophilia]|uniref:MBL fold metallo-hydrolase n=1 Tax=Stenotrophomonas maltophilia TaxID=40324 RepID=UPI0016561B5A|nr:MBL fold metallo-hydrolase [Stenotrophomonas maltophilia]MBC8772208.1 hypothetical protein [Stenotrophomonas maltophilia]